MNFLNRHWTGLREKACKNFPTCNRRIDRSKTEHVRNQGRRILLNQLGSSAHSGQLLGTERRNVARICLRQNEAPLPCRFRSELKRNHAPGFQQSGQRITAYTFPFRRNPGSHFVCRQITSSIEKMR